MSQARDKLRSGAHTNAQPPKAPSTLTLTLHLRNGSRSAQERRARGTSSYNLAVNFKSSMPARGARARRTQVRISAAREDDCARQAWTRHDATVA